LKIGELSPIQDTDDEGASGIQMRLRNLGFDPGPVDGIIGPCTTAAIRAFQQKHPPLDVDRICGPKTTVRLLKEHGS
jgi:peptidoglycan hydrolase-like protein with peptidoglycan-binding domain